MENVSLTRWEPSETEHTFLVWELRRMGNTIMTTADPFICTQLYNAYRGRFGTSHDPNIPAIEYLLRITGDYQHSLKSTPTTSFDLAPASFGAQDLSDPSLGLELFAGYMDPLPHNLIPSWTLHNTLIQLNNSALDFNQGAGSNYPDYYMHNLPPAPHDQMLPPTRDLMREARHESPTIDGPANKENPDDTTNNLAAIERPEPIVSQYLAKLGGHHTEKNMFYPNKTTASILYGKSIPEATAEVDEAIRQKPSLQPHCVKLINEKQKYKLLKTKIQLLHQHADEAFAFLVVSIAFLPTDGYERPRAMIFDCHSDGHQSFTHWLKATHGPAVLRTFLSYMDNFAEAVSVWVKHPDKEEDNTVKEGSKVAADDPVAWRDGIHYIKNPAGMKVFPLRAAYRAVACGWNDRKMPWKRIEEKPENFIQPGVIKKEITVNSPEKQDMDAFQKVVQLFYDHQEGRIPYKEGLLFMQCGSGSTLHYPTKRPRLANKGKASSAGANQGDPDTEDAQHIGLNWVNQFLMRHGDKLHSHWIRPLERIRATSSTQDAVDAYFKQYISLVGKDGSNIDPALQFAFDETGIQPSMFHSERVIGSSEPGAFTAVASGTDHQLTTFVPVISAANEFVTGLMIFPAKHMRMSYLGIEGNPHGLLVACSDTGYTNQVIGTQLIALIDSKTKELAQGRQRLIHVDGHNSHITAELIDNAIASNIVVFGYPAHMTHLLQGLDVVNFSILKALFYQEAKAFYEQTGKEPNKMHIIDLLIKPIAIAFSPSNISAAWRKTGLCPINPDIIPRAILRGSSISAHPNAFPGLPPSSPIANFIGAMRGQVQMLHIRPLVITTEPAASSVTELGPDLWPRKGNMPDPFEILSEQLKSLSMDDGTTTSASVIPQKAGTFATSLVNSLQGTSGAFLMHPRYISSSN